MKCLQKPVLLIVFWQLASLGFAFTLSAPQNVVARASEASLRKIATKVVMPNYPHESIKRGAKGVAVAELVIGVAGDVSNAEVLEAPDALIEKAVLEAVKQWKFRPTNVKGGGPVSVRGKLTFYFEINEKGQGKVENPRQYR